MGVYSLLPSGNVAHSFSAEQSKGQTPQIQTPVSFGLGQWHVRIVLPVMLIKVQDSSVIKDKIISF